MKAERTVPFYACAHGVPGGCTKDADDYRFDEYNEQHVAAVVPTELVKPIANLLQTRREIAVCERAGNFDKAAMCDALRQELDALYLACVSRWQDL